MRSWWVGRSDSIKAALISATVTLIGIIVAATIGIAGLINNGGQRSTTSSGIPSASIEVDQFRADPELGRFAARYRNSVIDCAQPDVETYAREIGLPIPDGRQINKVVRCYNTARWAVYFINFFNSDTRWFLYDALFNGRRYSGDCQGWGPKQPQPSPPAGQDAHVRLCFAANFKDGLGIYWEPAEDGDYERKYAGVLVTRGIDDDALQKIWDDHARIR